MVSMLLVSKKEAESVRTLGFHASVVVRSPEVDGGKVV